MGFLLSELLVLLGTLLGPLNEVVIGLIPARLGIGSLHPLTTTHPVTLFHRSLQSAIGDIFAL